jgi:hypothetical protein
MLVTCIKCNVEYFSAGAQIESFKNDLTQYVCMECDDLAAYTKRMEENK